MLQLLVLSDGVAMKGNVSLLLEAVSMKTIVTQAKFASMGLVLIPVC